MTCKHCGQPSSIIQLTNGKAALAYNEAAKKYFGPFAYLNVIDRIAGFPTDTK